MVDVTDQSSGGYPTIPANLATSNSGLSSSGGNVDRNDAVKNQSSSTPEAGPVPQNQQPFQQQFQHSRQSLQASQYNAQQGQPSGRPSALNMTSLGNALPDVNYGQNYIQQPLQRYQPGTSPTGLPFPVQQIAQYHGQPMHQQQLNSPYNIHYPQQYEGMYPGQQHSSAQLGQPGSSSGHTFYSNQNFVAPSQQQQLSPYIYQPNQYPSSGQAFQGNSYQSQYGGRLNSPVGIGPSGQRRSVEDLGAVNVSGARGHSTESNLGKPSTPRGPPRKPKQSGHALWVGNLPPGANVIDLKDHFSHEATNDILSVFLISKSNCAFVNYKTEASCAAAMIRFHDSRFHGVRLVCRLRRSSAIPISGVPTGPAALSGTQVGSSKEVSTAEAQIDEVDSVKLNSPGPAQPPAKDKFFIVKSLTVEDLEMSVRNGIWATQSHNEDALNKAYETADAVYLIFSANKSGEYFGYARMISPLNDDPNAAIQFAPKPQEVEDPDLPRAIPTAATESAPKGRIIDDSARGTIFWEAETDESEIEEGNNSDNSDQEGESGAAKAWGKPFKLEWQSTNRLPFYRTRGLRNPWNSNREVKIARDGTELETSIGRRLIQMFHREASPPVPQMPNMVPGQMPPMMGGYPQMRLY